MLYGHTKKKKLFERLVNAGSLSHAYLFFGDSGIGKFLFAKELTSFLETGKWEKKEHSHPLVDVREFCQAEDKIFIGIDEAREIKTFLWSTPMASSRRVAIINNAHLLTSEAQSAMLKIVEEPPRHALVIFISHDISVLSAPLLSRLTKVYFQRFSKKEIIDFLKRQNVSESKSISIAEQSHGRPALALSLLHGEEVGEDEDIIEKHIVKLYKLGVLKNSEVLESLLDKQVDIKRFRLNKELQKKSIQELLYAKHN